MKHMKIALAAMLAVVMGTTFTSCLNSDRDDVNYAYVTINTSMGIITSLTTDDGYELVPQNASQMTLDGSIPKRAYIAFKLLEGEKLSSNSSARVSFVDYYDILYVRDMSDGLVETATRLLAISQDIWSANGYLNVAAAYYSYTVDSPDDFSLYIDRIEDNTIYFKLAFTKEVEETSTYSAKSLSYILPSEEEIKESYPAALIPDSNGYYNAVLIADGVNSSGDEVELKSNTSKIALP
ncbi:MAG: hypothetical protein LBG18_07275 [Mediterranea sp.]|nr:hypothetical protein [Mediterranea sp.]